MRYLDQSKRLVGRFGRDRNGNFAVLTGMLATTLALSVGFAINIGQMFQVKSSLRNALDSAVTSTARDLTTGTIPLKDARKTIEAFLNANQDMSFATTDNFVLDTVVIDPIARTIDATASAHVYLAFPLFSTGNPRISVESAAVYSDRTIEVAMMLDLTGSMSGQKIKDLRTAASNAVDSFLGGQKPGSSRIRLALIPYANAVNAGSLAPSSVFVETKTTGRTPAPGNDDPAVISAGAAPRPDNCATERKGPQQYTDAGPDVAMVSRDLLLTQFAKDSRTIACPVAAVMPLTTNADALKNEIDKFSAEGGTAGHIGVQWAWYMLSDRWNSVLAKSQRPAKRDAKKVMKYAILMTDGEFNLSYFDVDAAADVYNGRGKAATRNAATKLCDAMRDDGIQIFTIGFKLENSYAKATMKSCANEDTGSIKHYYEVSTGAELDGAFKEIARNIERVALTK